MNHKENRKARVRTVIALILDGKEYTFDGIVNGSITTEKRGDSGFGYDPIFMPDTYTQTFAEMGNDTKNQISHRAKAVMKLTSFLSDYNCEYETYTYYHSIFILIIHCMSREF